MKFSDHLQALPVGFGTESRTLTSLFVRVHKAEGEQEGIASLFVCGLPVLQQNLNETLEALFGAFGPVVSIFLHQSQLSAMVVFSQSSSLEKVMRFCEQSQIIEVPLAESEGSCGVKRWLLEHKSEFPGNQKLKTQLNDWIEAFEQKEEEAKRQAAISNDDGWTVVTRKPGRRKTTDTETGIAVGGISKAVAEKRLAKKPVKQLIDFYTHQRREKQRSDLMSLQKRFEEDKRKVAGMKAARRYKPY